MKRDFDVFVCLILFRVFFNGSKVVFGKSFVLGRGYSILSLLKGMANRFLRKKTVTGDDFNLQIAGSKSPKNPKKNNQRGITSTPHPTTKCFMLLGFA